MWCFLAVVLVAFVAVRGDEQAAAALGGGSSTFGTRGAMAGFMEPRLGGAAMRLAKIEHNIENIRGRLEEASKVDGQAFIDDINERLDHVEAKTDHCDSNREIRCGRDTLECVNTLLLCDGVEDCHNGYDESENVCDAGPVVIGNVFTGTVHWTSCKPKADHPVKITITQTYKAKFFGARLVAKGIISTDFTDTHDHSHHEYDVRGYYVYGQKKLVLLPSHEEDNAEQLGVVCDFIHGNNESAECVLASKTSLHECAKFHITLHEEEH